MQTKRVVVWDPSLGPEWLPDGYVVQGPRAALALESRGAVLLPADAELLDRPPNGISGWAKRSFGAGLPTGNGGASVIGRRFAPVTFWVDRDRGNCLHWAARVVVAPRRSGSADELSGTFRLSADPGQAGCASGGLGSEGASVDVAALGPADRWGGWTVAGRQSLASFSGGLFGLSLYGTARGIAIAWVAVSQARE
jgi:hypothetical protein